MALLNPKTRLSPIPTSVVLSQSVWAVAKDTKNWGSAGACPLGWGVADPKTHPSPHVARPNLIFLRQRI